MKNLLMLSLFLLLFFNCTPTKTTITPSEEPGSATAVSETKTNDDVCLSLEEKNLYNLIMAYRKEKGLPAISLSASLSQVAQLHVTDLKNNRPAQGKCNLHSWSKAYGACCYTSDHSNANCMWDKPRELTDYTGNGYEIAHWSSDGADATSSFNGWKNSSGHNAVMINTSIWKEVDWNAIGIGIRDEYSVVWFGKETDLAGKPGNCK